MTRKISVTGYVPDNEKETQTLNECGFYREKIRKDIRDAVYSRKKVAEDYFASPVKKVRITVEIDVETLS